MISGDFIPVSLDAEKHRAVTRKMGVHGFPTSLVLNADLKIVSTIKGYRTPAQLAADLSGFRNDQSENLSVYGKACPVEPMDHGKFAIGKEKWSTEYQGFRLFFASEQNQMAFAANPEKYWPVNDGLCVISRENDGVDRIGKLEFATLFEGRPWLFSSKANKKTFDANADKYAHFAK